MSDIPPRWYCVDRHGMTTLCADEDNARAEAAENDIRWPRNAPHTAVQLAPVPAQGAEYTAAKSTWDRHDRIEFALRDAGFGEPEAAGITEAVEAVLDGRAQGAEEVEALAQAVIEERLLIPSHEAGPVAQEIARRLRNSPDGSFREDAERYRHYRNNSTVLLCVRADRHGGLNNVRIMGRKLDELTDAAIDAARSSGGDDA